VNIADVDDTMVESLVASYPSHHWVEEHGESGKHTHYHVYVSHTQGKNEVIERQETVRRRWIKVFRVEQAQMKIALKVVPVTDYQRLLGSYMQKEKGVIVRKSTFTTEQCESLHEMYKNVSSKYVKKDKNRYLTVQHASDEIINYAKVNDMPLDSKDDFVHVLQHMVQNGFRCATIMNRLKFVWTEIEMISGRTVNFLDFL